MARLGRIPRLLLLGLTGAAALLGLALLAAQRLFPQVTPWYLRASATACLLALLLVLVLWLLWVGLRRFLWRVSRRLAFSYFLIGVLPIPMVLLLAGLNVYLLSGYFLGHLYRGTAKGLEVELQTAADLALNGWPGGLPPTAAGEPVRLVFYRRGAREAGADVAPASWPQWLEAVPTGGPVAYVELSDGSLALAAAARRGGARRPRPGRRRCRAAADPAQQRLGRAAAPRGAGRGVAGAGAVV